jgi:Fe-S cluster biogenesis protein NfuA
MREKVEEVINAIKPSLQADGGDIELIGIEDDGMVQVRLLGACAGCPMSQMTLSNFVEKILKEKVPGVKGVKSV